MTNHANQNKILIIDDHPTTRKLLQSILQEYSLLLANNGEEALAILKNTPGVDLILLDIIMPGMNGYEVCQQIKGNPTTKDIPVIFLTVMGEEQDEKLGFLAGVADYIIKPVSRVRLQARIANHLKIKRQQELLNHKKEELQKALDELKKLSGILPICSFCKQIRDSHGDWQKLEFYIHQHSDAKFSHSVCPDCMKKHYNNLL